MAGYVEGVKARKGVDGVELDGEAKELFQKLKGEGFKIEYSETAERKGSATISSLSFYGTQDQMSKVRAALGRNKVDIGETDVEPAKKDKSRYTLRSATKAKDIATILGRNIDFKFTGRDLLTKEGPGGARTI